MRRVRRCREVLRMVVASSDIIVYDQLEACPYLASRAARLPMRLPLQPLSPDAFDVRLEAGDRRNGSYLYRASCPDCAACEAIRVDVHRFRPNRTQRRIERRGETLFAVRVTRPIVDAQRVRLFNMHREKRGLAQTPEPVSIETYQAFLGESCCDSWEIDYYREGQLVIVAICDRGCRALSAVYSYYDTAVSCWSPGVFSILTQMRLCREWGLRYLYLGYFIAESPHMSYKARYLPHERLIGDRWQPFESV
jgi:arginine-tRNA-protein transferase